MTLKKSSSGIIQVPLPKGKSCLTCKARKVRCDAVRPACSSCVRSARFEHRDLSTVCCQYKDDLNSGVNSSSGTGGKVKKERLSKRKERGASSSSNGNSQSNRESTLDELRKLVSINELDSIAERYRLSQPLPENKPHCSYPLSISTNFSDSTTFISRSTNSLDYISTPTSSTFSSIDSSFTNQYYSPINTKNNNDFTNFEFDASSSSTSSYFNEPQLYPLPSLYTSTLPFLPHLSSNPSSSASSSAGEESIPEFDHEEENFLPPSNNSLFPQISTREDLYDGYFGLDGLLASSYSTNKSFDGTWTPTLDFVWS